MITVRLYKYLDSLIQNEDSYALDVLYFCLRRTIEKHNFSLAGIKEIIIDEKFLPEAVHVSLVGEFSLQHSAIALLLSLRTIQLNPNLFKYCTTDELLFKSKIFKSYGWVRYGSLLLKYQDDDDFYSLFCMLEAVEYVEGISDSLKEQFHRNTLIPPFKNLDNYYKQMANSEKENTGQVITNNAYVCVSQLIDLTIPKSVEYVGNTAIAFCENLEKLIFQRPNIRFGVFPIVECPNLKSIIVPEGSEEYYKKMLPFYKDIIRNANEEYAVDSNGVEVLVGEHADVLSQATDMRQEVIDKQQECLSENQNIFATESSVDLRGLADVFRNRTTTYKFFWLLSILDLVQEKRSMCLSFQEIISKMLTLAWPLVNNQIKFGPKDGIPNILLSLAAELGIVSCNNSEKVERLIYQKYTDKKIHKKLSVLTKNVPYRFLSPWVKYTTDAEVRSLSQSLDCDTPYALYEDSIVIDESWFDCFVENYDELHSFAKSSLVDYLKYYNNELVLLGLIENMK